MQQNDALIKKAKKIAQKLNDKLKEVDDTSKEVQDFDKSKPQHKKRDGFKSKKNQEKMRINKFISHNLGYSRREADKLIKDGKVSINSKIVTDFVEVDINQKVRVGSKLVKPKVGFSVIVYNKPKGELVTKHDDRGRKTIYDSLPSGFKNFISIGRLDYASEGLLLLTDAPDVATLIQRSDLEREYYLKVRGKVTETVKEAMRTGLQLQDATKGAHAKSEIKQMSFKPFVAFDIFGFSGGYTKLRVMISEGKNRELRRFFGYFDLEVVELKRVAFGRVDLGMLKEGKWRYFSKAEYDDLKEFLKNNR